MKVVEFAVNKEIRIVLVINIDALNLLATCIGLETLIIEAGVQCLKSDSPGVFALRKIRGLALHTNNAKAA